MRVPAAPSSAPAHDAPIAIIGIAGRYPQADDLDAFWRNLVEGRDCIGEVPGERWHHAALFHPERNRPGTSYSKWGGFLDGIDRFDALFFGISPKEACVVVRALGKYLSTVKNVEALYECKGATPKKPGTPVLLQTEFEGWHLKLVKSYNFYMTMPGKSFKVTGQDFPVNCS